MVHIPVIMAVCHITPKLTGLRVIYYLSWFLWVRNLGDARPGSSGLGCLMGLQSDVSCSPII